MSNDAYTKYKEKIINFYLKHKRMPGYKEIMSLVGFKSKNAVYKLINKLVADEVVDKDSQGRLVPIKIFGQIPLLGLVEAGIPTNVEEDRTNTVSLDEYLAPNIESSYLLEVKGDSMKDEGIMEGDLVLVEKRNNPKDGDIVIAEVDGGWTMKYFRKKGDRVFLEAANENYEPIYPEYDLKVAAIVKAVIRKY